METVNKIEKVNGLDLKVIEQSVTVKGLDFAHLLVIENEVKRLSEEELQNLKDEEQPLVEHRATMFTVEEVPEVSVDDKGEVSNITSRRINFRRATTLRGQLRNVDDDLNHILRTLGDAQTSDLLIGCKLRIRRTLWPKDSIPTGGKSPLYQSMYLTEVIGFEPTKEVKNIFEAVREERKNIILEQLRKGMKA